MVLAYVAIFAAIAGVVVFSVIFMLQDIKKAKSALVGVGALVVAFLICYVLADSTPYSTAEISIESGQMKFINAGIFSVYILVAGSVLAVAYASVSHFFKK
jgi:uncharacterized membrane protein YozB (DUF420 family)